VRFFSIIIVSTILIATTVAAGLPRLEEKVEGAAGLQQPEVGESATPQGDVFATGLVEGRCREIVLGFELTGRVLAVKVQEGELVSAGISWRSWIRPSGNSNWRKQRQVWR